MVQHLSKAAPDFSGPLLQKEVVFVALFGEAAKFEAQKVFNQMSRLRQLWEKFVSIESLGQDDRQQELSLLQGLDRWGMEDQISRSYDRFWERHQAAPYKDNAYFLHHHQLLAFAELGSRNQRRGMNAVVLERMEALDLFYLTTRLKYSCEWLNRKFISNLSGEDQLVQALVNELSRPDHPYLAIPAVSIYFQIMQTFLKPEEEAFYQELLNQLDQYAQQFSPRELEDMYNYALNYCIRKINQGKSQYFLEIFEIYKRQLTNRTMLRDGYLPHEHYKNITTVGLRLKKYDWVKSFLDQYKRDLHPDYQENAYTYNLSAYYYEQQRYTEAMKLLQMVSFTDVYMDLSARSMLLRIYYETGDMDSLRYHLEAFRAFLKRNKSISKIKLEQNLALIRFSKKLMRLYKSRRLADPQNYEERRLALKESLANANSLHLSWLRTQ
ncbi:MAG: hypothetical protein AAGM67_07745, partial [Bacteroidota bacterium]